MTSFGKYLRQQREAKGVTLEEIARATGIDIKYLEALEKEEFNIFPSGYYIRGYVRAYSDYLKSIRAVENKGIALFTGLDKFYSR